MPVGVVKWFNPKKGYGFISPEDGGDKDAFVHITAVQGAGLDTLNEGDKVLMFETGHFATEWSQTAQRYNVNVDFVPGNWRYGADPKIVEQKLCKINVYFNMAFASLLVAFKGVWGPRRTFGASFWLLFFGSVGRGFWSLSGLTTFLNL